MIAGNSSTWQLGELRFSEALYLPDSRLEPHCDGRFRISIVVSGQVRERVCGIEESASAPSVVTKPANAMHSNHFGPTGARIISVAIPTMLLDGIERRSGSPCRWRWIHAAASKPAVDIIGLVRGCRTARTPSADRALEYVEVLLDALSDIPAPLERNAPAWPSSVRDHVRDTFDKPTPVRIPARAARVHPTHLTRWFRKFYGCPVTVYRQRLRIKAAMEALAASDIPLAEIAVATGFCDQSHLTHSIRGHTGMTPDAIRRMAGNRDG